MSKGSQQRPTDLKRFASNWDAIFGKKEEERPLHLKDCLVVDTKEIFDKLDNSDKVILIRELRQLASEGLHYNSSLFYIKCKCLPVIMQQGVARVFTDSLKIMNDATTEHESLQTIPAEGSLYPGYRINKSELSQSLSKKYKDYKYPWDFLELFLS